VTRVTKPFPRSGERADPRWSTRPSHEPPEPPRLYTSESIDTVFRQAEQAQRAQQQQQETENEPVRQLTSTDGMTPAQIVEAHQTGQLGDLLRGGPPQAVLSPAELRIKQLEYDGITQLASTDGMTPAQIVTAHREGRLTAMLTGITPPASED
jgi:hypothetical protein